MTVAFAVAAVTVAASAVGGVIMMAVTRMVAIVRSAACMSPARGVRVVAATVRGTRRGSGSAAVATAIAVDASTVAIVKFLRIGGAGPLTIVAVLGGSVPLVALPPSGVVSSTARVSVTVAHLCNRNKISQMIPDYSMFR